MLTNNLLKKEPMKVLAYALKESWSKDTCYQKVRDNWSITNKALGQCAITSLIVNDYLGGKIYKTKIKGISHYFNIIEKKTIDLTDEQFKIEERKYLNIEKKKRETLLKNEDTFQRYNLLKEKVTNFLINLEKLETDIKKCYKCKKLVDKFEHSQTIYFGQRTDLLLLGEAPANNGWRKSKVIWKDTKGKFLPSALIMQKLLDPLKINLLDLSFTEAIKCYPIKRNNLETCKINCKKFLFEQIELLNPKIIITLGNYATRSLLDINYKNFKEVVGQIYEINIKGKTVMVLPIYHPSPISPLSYKGNIEIMKKLEKILK